ncbi:unnamed protein product, partial [Ascophyllum nodosum]
VPQGENIHNGQPVVGDAREMHGHVFRGTPTAGDRSRFHHGWAAQLCSRQVGFYMVAAVSLQLATGWARARALETKKKLLAFPPG